MCAAVLESPRPQVTKAVRLHYQDIMPAEVFTRDAVLKLVAEKKIDVLILQAAPTGAVPNAPECDYAPVFVEAGKNNIPVFVLRGVFHAAGEEPAQRYRRNPPNPYEPEVTAIQAGAIPIEMADASMALEILKVIRTAWENAPNPEAVRKAICERYNTPEFNAALERIRDRKG